MENKKELKPGDIIYIQNSIFIVEEIRGNINGRYLEGLEFDYFGLDEDYILLCNTSNLSDFLLDGI